MSTTINSLGTNSSVSSLTNTNSVTANSADAQSDRFLKLLVAQLNNQDPLNPMDNAQMTSQMAQINTVAGIQQLNDSIKSMASQFVSMQMLQASSIVGREVLTEGNALAIKDGIAKGGLDLASDADKVSIQILSPGGQLVDTLELGAQTAGRRPFEWDASKHTEFSTLTFKVVASKGKVAVEATPLSRSTVTSVSSENGALTAQLNGRSAVKYDQIKSIL